MEPIKELIVYGTKNEIAGGEEYIIQGSSRGNDKRHPVDVRDATLELVLDDGTTWLCDSATLHEVFPEFDPALRKQRRSETEAFELPTTVDPPATERGLVGKVLVKALRVFAKKKLDQGMGDLARNLEDKHLTYGIPEDSGIWKNISKQTYLANGAAIFTLNSAFEFQLVENKPNNKPYFLFIHGTNSDTRSAFWDLKSSPAWATLHDIYKENVWTFQHRTLTESPLENVLKLAEMLPDGVELHLLTHSRGGLIGDILNKYSSNGEPPLGFTDDHISLLEKENRTGDIKNIEAINEIFQSKRIKVSKFIRIACPAAGTKLASNRVDHFLNVLFNLLGGVFGDVLKELLTAAVNSKDNVEVLPGLEAMNPESPFIKILNDQADTAAIDGKPLMVISGNGRVNFSGNGLLVILGRLFYWQRNDLVVNTDSMYLGARRKNDIQYFFDQDAGVNHVKYFENNKTREAINLALKTEAGSLVPGYKAVTQYAVPDTDRALIEHGELYPDAKLPTGSKPIVILLPGIMGSNLRRKDRELWLHYGQILKGGLMDLRYPNLEEIVSDSIVRTSYFKLYKRLSDKYDVIVYPFDWRRPLTECARDLNTKIVSLLKLNQPIKIIGHSMGGVLVRDFIVNHKETWQRLNASKDFRLVFLGAPLGGSHRILTVLFGADGIIKKLSTLDLFHSKKELLKMFAKFPGILGLLPVADPQQDPESDFADIRVWEKMRVAFGDPDWPLPSREDLENFKSYRTRILQEMERLDYTNTVYIAGKDKMTPCGYFLDTIPPKKGLRFLYTAEGDQSVTWASGIPRRMPEDAIYYTQASHGALANEPSLFSGIEEILAKGRTRLLSNSRPAVRGEEKIFATQPDIDFDFTPEGLERTILGITSESTPESSQIPVTVSVSNGDLRYASYPILAGHFLNDGILDAEAAVNQYLEGSLTLKHRFGLYPGEIGSHAIFPKMEGSDFAGAIIVGMGEQDQLTSFQLSRSIEQAVVNYLLETRAGNKNNDGHGLSAVVIGGGYGGLSIEYSLDAVITGVNRANDKIKSLNSEFPTIRHLEFVELYSDRALNCMYALNQLGKNENSSFNMVVANKGIKQLLGSRKRIPLNLSENWWNRITVQYRPGNEENGQLPSMVFNSSTVGSREDSNEIYSSIPIIDLFLAEISVNNQWSASSAKTLFELLIPNSLKEKLKRKCNISWVLDGQAASYPWELLQDSTTNAKPLCINSGMIRQLTTPNYRDSIKRVSERAALVVADPNLDGFVGQLAGARDEGKLVSQVLQNAGYPTTDLIGTNASAIVSELFCNEYSVIHLAGHGAYNPKSPKASGMVIGRNIFLTVFEIKQMTVVPDLVFVNCCYLGNTTETDERLYQDRYKLAANIGTELIGIGVKAVIAAGWAVDDAAALDFAKVFYQKMFSGYSFGEAVTSARSLIYDRYPGTNTWGAYQCYGDPHFKFRDIQKEPSTRDYIVPEEVEIDLDNLLNKLQMSTTGKEKACDTLSTIMNSIAGQERFDTAEIREKEAKIYLEMGMYEEAVNRFEILLSMEKADFSLTCIESYCNTRLKWYVRKAFQDMNHPNVFREYYSKAEQVIRDLGILLTTGQNVTRFNLLGSAYKHLAMLATEDIQRIKAYKMAMSYYQRAYLDGRSTNKAYSFCNALEIGYLLTLSGSLKPRGEFIVEGVHYKLNAADHNLKLLREDQLALKNKAVGDLDYWDMVAFLNMDLCILFLTEDTNEAEAIWNRLKDEYLKIWQKAGSEAKKVTELEHLQFLIHALYKTAKNPASFSNIGTAAPEEKLEQYLDELRKALEAARGKTKLNGRDPGKIDISEANMMLSVDD